MRSKKFLSAMLGVILTFPLSHLSALEAFHDGFEEYTSGTGINGLPIGATTWSAAGVVAGDLAVVSGTQAFTDGGGQSLYLSQGATGGRPRVSVSLTSGSFISTAISRGSVSFAVCEDPGNPSGANYYTTNVGNFAITRFASGGTGRLSFSLGSNIISLYFTGTHYTYTPGAWNTFELTFDDVLKTSSLYINGGLASTITGGTTSYAVSSITLGLYSSSQTGDKVFFDDVDVYKLDGSQFASDFETYAPGSGLLGQTIGSTTWSGQLASGDQELISGSFASSGSNSFNLLETGVHGSVNAGLDFVSGSFMPAAAQGGVFTFDVNEQPNAGGYADSFNAVLSNISIQRTGSTIAASIALTSSTYSLTLPLSTDNYVYTTGTWNNFTVAFDNANQRASLYVNGGYAGQLTQQIGSGTGNYSVHNLSLRDYSNGIYTNVFFDNLLGDFNGAPGSFYWRSALYPATWSPNPAAGTPGYVDAKGHSIQDFSYAGYHTGTIPIPNVTGPNYIDVTQAPYSADNTGTSDATTAIQNAINYVSTNGGGVVFMPSGTYNVAPPNRFVSGALVISKSNVVLRGAGTNQTFILNTATTMHYYQSGTLPVNTQNVITVKSGTATDWYSDNVGSGQGAVSNPSILTVMSQGDIPAQTTSIPVTSVSGFNVGDLVMVRNDLTSTLVSQLGSAWTNGWWGGNHQYLCSIFARRITAINAATNTLTIDVPTRYPLLRSANARVVRPLNPMLQEVGLENFSIGMIENSGTNDWGYLQDSANQTNGTPANQVTNCSAITLNSAENCWVTNVSTYHPPQNTMSTPFTPQIDILSHGIGLYNTRLITLSNCDFGYSQYDGGGGNGYMYTMAGQETLAQNCSAEYGRHNISFDHMECSGNVFLNATVTHCRLSCDFHQMLSTANLLDSTVSYGDILEAYPNSTPETPEHGWTATQCVFWNTTGNSYGTPTNGTNWIALIYANDYNTAVTPLPITNYIIGTKGPASAVFGACYAEGVSDGDKLLPQSLYLDQRKKRLGF